MDLERFKKEALKEGNAEKLKGIADSDAVKRIEKTVDGEAIKKAFQAGDKKALEQMVGRVLATQDGQQLLKRLEDSFGKQK